MTSSFNYLSYTYMEIPKTILWCVYYKKQLTLIKCRYRVSILYYDIIYYNMCSTIRNF